jgi:hypothetical protein
MCDYSLHTVTSRPARVGDQLVTSDFPGTMTRGFAALGHPGTAVCLVPGTEIAFAQEAQRKHLFASFGFGKLAEHVARFRQINMHDPLKHHDALEFANGRIVLVTELRLGQRVTVLQLPAQTRIVEDARDASRLEPDETTPNLGIARVQGPEEGACIALATGGCQS